MATLKTEHKEFIIKELARFKAKNEVEKSVEERFGLSLQAPQISFYDPETRNGSRLADKWKHLFYEVRRKYVEEEAKVPIFHKAYRLNEMQENYDKAKKSGNIVLAQDILDQAAKEAGGMYERGVVPTTGEGGDFYQQINNIIMQKDG